MTEQNSATNVRALTSANVFQPLPAFAASLVYATAATDLGLLLLLLLATRRACCAPGRGAHRDPETTYRDTATTAAVVWPPPVGGAGPRAEMAQHMLTGEERMEPSDSWAAEPRRSARRGPWARVYCGCASYRLDNSKMIYNSLSK